MIKQKTLKMFNSKMKVNKILRLTKKINIYKNCTSIATNKWIVIINTFKLNQP